MTGRRSSSRVENGDTPRRRLLVVSRKVHRTREEGAEVREQIAGLLEAERPGDPLVSVSDCRHVFRAEVSGGLVLRRKGSIVRAWIEGVDVVHVHHLHPVVRHLAVALLFRLRGARVLFSPMGFLSDDFASATWTFARPRSWTRAKPIVVRLLGAMWRRVAHAFVCLSRHEVASSRLPPERCLLLPWPRPDTPVLRDDPGPIDAASDASQRPAVFISSRMGPWRKGIDRMCAWVSSHAADLPRPAVVLLAPRGPADHPELDAVTADGLVIWDADARGAAMVRHLRNCRASMLLSRYEGQPRSLREAIWLGVPIICTPTCNLDDVVAATGCGVVVSGDDASEIQTAFELLNVRPSMERARAVFDRRRIARFYLGTVNELASGSRPTALDYYRDFDTIVV